MVTAVIALTLGFSSPSPAATDTSAQCPPAEIDPTCRARTTEPDEPKSESNNNVSGTGNACIYNGPDSADYKNGDEVPCHHPSYGWWAGDTGVATYGCWHHLIEERRENPEEWPPPEGQGPEGAWYVRTCIYQPIGGCTFWCGVAVWLDAPPGPVDPETLARRALAQILLLAPDPQVSPPETGAGLVGLPVWLSAGTATQAWGPVSDDECDLGLCVSITATVDRIEWEMGDGVVIPCSRSEIESSAWKPGREPMQPGPCHHVYRQPSRHLADGRYPITATAVWHVDWEGGGQRGTLTAERISTTSIRVNEVQVLVIHE